jgi:glycosyltransferase involved in cell wall biosynthesis
MSTLIVHEWIARTGGSERVLDRMVGVFPDARVLCLWNEDAGRYPHRDVRETWLGRTPLRGHKALALPVSALAWRHAGAALDVDTVVVSSHAFAHHVRAADHGRAARKFVYVHTPARYLWAPELDHRGARGTAARLAAGPVLRAVDRRRASDDMSIAANSDFVRRRVADAWHRDARVIYPPVDVERLQAVEDWSEQVGADEAAVLDVLPAEFVLGASRFVPYKRLDVVIAAGEAVRLPVVLAGSGPQEPALRERARQARVPVTFVDHPSDALLYALYQRALVLVFPPVEDFGIMPVEAMACGTPVVANAVGGARESVGAPVGGALVEDFGPRELAAAVHAAAGRDRHLVRRQARRFSARRFDAELAGWVGGEVGAPQEATAHG